jgi:hypothetical protein
MGASKKRLFFDPAEIFTSEVAGRSSETLKWNPEALREDFILQRNGCSARPNHSRIAGRKPGNTLPLKSSGQCRAAQLLKLALGI